MRYSELDPPPAASAPVAELRRYAKNKMDKKESLILPILHEGAEHLVIGYLMRRNILAYKAPPKNEGYDIICIHPDPRKITRQIRVQVKSRYATDCNRAIFVKSKSFKAFDYLIAVFQNIGFYYKNRPTKEGLSAPEFFTLPVSFVRKNHSRQGIGLELFQTKSLNLTRYKNELGFEQIAKDLGIRYPSKTA